MHIYGVVLRTGGRAVLSRRACCGVPQDRGAVVVLVLPTRRAHAATWEWVVVTPPSREEVKAAFASLVEEVARLNAPTKPVITPRSKPAASWSGAKGWQAAGFSTAYHRKGM